MCGVCFASLLVGLAVAQTSPAYLDPQLFLQANRTAVPVSEPSVAVPEPDGRWSRPAGWTDHASGQADHAGGQTDHAGGQTDHASGQTARPNVGGSRSGVGATDGLSATRGTGAHGPSRSGSSGTFRGANPPSGRRNSDHPVRATAERLAAWFRAAPSALHRRLTRHRGQPDAARSGSDADSGCAEGRLERPPLFSGSVLVGVWAGGLNGHLQTPAGGQPGSTSPKRPRVEEIGLDGLDWMPLLDVRLCVAGRHELHVDSVWIDRSGTDVLQQPLVSQNQTFSAGAAVASHFGLDTVRFGYRPLWLQWRWGRWSFTPEIGVGSSRFQYQLRSSQASGPVDRRYNVGFPYLGLLVHRPLSQRFTFETELAGTGGVNGVSLIDCDFSLSWRLLEATRADVDAVLGWRGLWFRRHDGQKLEQNDPNVRFGWLSSDPWVGLTLGLRLDFY